MFITSNENQNYLFCRLGNDISVKNFGHCYYKLSKQYLIEVSKDLSRQTVKHFYKTLDTRIIYIQKSPLYLMHKCFSYEISLFLIASFS